MKKALRNISIFVFPFLLMVVINEFVRSFKKEKPFRIHDQTAMNPIAQKKDKCTWACHEGTAYCKSNHVKFNKKYLPITDSLYFGVIHSLEKTDYVSANIIFLVLFIPFFIWFFLVKSLNIQDEINKIKRA